MYMKKDTKMEIMSICSKIAKEVNNIILEREEYSKEQLMKSVKNIGDMSTDIFIIIAKD